MNSIVSYPDRGIGGSNTYRGNCSPRLIEDIVQQYRITGLSDYMVGGGTTEDVCKRLGISGTFLDLHRGYDMMTMDIPERAENIFWHPPYHDIIIYSDQMYPARQVAERYGFDPRTNDLSRCDSWPDFVKKMNYCCMKQFTSMEKGGRLFILMGDIKKKGQLYSMLLNMVKPGTVEQLIIKAQHNCTSSSQVYSGRFVPILHEYLLVLRKDAPLVFSVQVARTIQADMRDMKGCTWRDVVTDLLSISDRPMTLQEIYQRMHGHKRCETNPHWQAKIRQTLRDEKHFKHVGRGMYRCIA